MLAFDCFIPPPSGWRLGCAWALCCVLCSESMNQRVPYYDEALTMSARLAVSTGDAQWVDRYNSFVPPLDEVIASIVDLAPALAARFLATTDMANQILIGYETEALDIVVAFQNTSLPAAQRNLTRAQELLYSDAYATQKSVLLTGLQVLSSSIAADTAAEASKQTVFTIVLGVIYGLIVLLTIVTAVYSNILSRGMSILVTDLYKSLLSEYEAAVKGLTTFERTVTTGSAHLAAYRTVHRYGELVPLISSLRTVFVEQTRKLTTLNTRLTRSGLLGEAEKVVAAKARVIALEQKSK
jgi:hypothetical protein